MNEEYDYIINAFTKDGENVNEEIDNLTVGCINSKDGKFGIDSEGHITGKSLEVEEGMFSRQAILDLIYPIGSIYMSITETSPDILIGGGWEQIKDTFLLACGDSYANGSVGGSASHSHTVNSHTHTSAAHTHGLSNGYAKLNPSANVTSMYYNVKTVSSWTDNAKSAISGKAASNSTDNTRGIALAGNSNSTTPGATGAAAPGTTASSNLPPYLAVYIWKRVS